LALAALRENKKHVARKQFTELVPQIPENPLFTNELVGVAGELQFPQQATGHVTHYKRAPLFGVGFDRSDRHPQGAPS
jgi:hypothetical protein